MVEATTKFFAFRKADARSVTDNFGTYPSALADLSHTGRLTIDVLTPGGSLSFLSGTDYRSSPPVSGVPEASAWAMLVLGFAGIGLMTILVIVSIVIVMNTIRTAVYHRRKEIEVMKLVGATEWFVRGPFVLEGIMTGVIAAAIALSLLVIAYPPVVSRFSADITFIPLTYDPTFISSLARDLLVGGALLGALGSYIGVRRFVRL